MPHSAWAHETQAEWAEQLGKMSEKSKSKSTQPPVQDLLGRPVEFRIDALYQLLESVHRHFPRRDMKEVVDETEGNLAAGGDLLLSTHLKVVVLSAVLHDDHTAGYRAGQVKPITSCSQY